MNFKKIILGSICLLATSHLLAQPFARKMSMLVHGNNTPVKTFSIQSNSDILALPVSVDNSKNIFFPPILDQDGGSCAQASGIGYMFTYEMNRLLGSDAKLSADNRFSYQFSWNMINGGNDEGGFVDQGLLLAQKFGMMSESDYGYSSLYSFRWATGYDKYFRAMHNRTAEIIQIEDSVPLIKRYLYDSGNGSQTGSVITFSTQSSNWKINNDYQGPSETGYHSLLTQLATEGAHALTIAGYDDLVSYTDGNGITHTGAFIVVNSWGSYMHDSGRFYLPYDFFRQRHSDYQLSTTLIGVRVMKYEPKVVFKVNLTYSSRNDLAFGMNGTKNAAATSSPYSFAYCYAFRNMGGDNPMQGHWQDGDIELAMDFTSGMPQTGEDFKKFFLDVYCSSLGTAGTGTVDNVQVYDYRFSSTPRIYTSRAAFPVTISRGQNIISIPMAPRYVVAASPFAWLNENGELSSKTYLLRTAQGRHGKMQVSSYDKQSRTLTLKYSVLNK